VTILRQKVNHWINRIIAKIYGRGTGHSISILGSSDYESLRYTPFPAVIFNAFFSSVLYISTVDSGNLAGHLLTLRYGLFALPDDPILGSRLFEGISDTVRVLVDVEGKTASDQLVQLQKLLKSATDSPPTTLAAAQ